MHSSSQKSQNVLLTSLVSSLIFVVVAFGGGLYLGRDIAYGQISNTISDKYDSVYLGELLKLVEDEYIGEFPDKETLTHEMARGIVDALGDEYSAFLDPEESKAYLNQSDSAYEGIGVQLGFDGQYTTVDTPIDKLPGAKAGMKQGDLIVEVDGEDMTGIRPEIVATKIRGKAGTQVKIKVYRPKSNKFVEFKIAREKIDLENISFKRLEDGVVVIDIVKFTEGEKGNLSGVQVFNAQWDVIVSKIKAEGMPKGIILDLRNNPGGFVESVKYVAEDFLEAGDIIMREEQNNLPQEVFKSSRKGEFTGVPVIVLVNEGSASAAEILSAALRDNDVAEIVGTKTVGKGVEQRLTTMPDGSIVMLVFKRWLTAGGVQISAESPITPDVLVELDPEQPTKDAQMDKAIELLEK